MLRPGGNFRVEYARWSIEIGEGFGFCLLISVFIVQADNTDCRDIAECSTIPAEREIDYAIEMGLHKCPTERAGSLERDVVASLFCVSALLWLSIPPS